MKDFYNRKKEQNCILTVVNEISNTGKLIMLYGQQGTGKSALIEYLSNQLINVKHLKVNMRGSVGEEGYYIKTLYRRLADYSDKEKQMLTPYQHDLLDPATYKANIPKLAKSIAKIPTNISISVPVVDHSMIQMKKYIIDTLKDRSFIIEIENIQRVDQLSLDFFNDIIRHTSNVTFVLEYTLPNESTYDMYKLYDELSKEIEKHEKVKIDMLPFEEARKLLPKNISTDELTKIKNEYISHNGNLYHLKMYIEDMDNTSNYIHNKIQSLKQNNSKMYLLFLLHLNNEALSYHYLVKICTYPSTNFKALSIQQFEEVLYELVNEHIITAENDYYFIDDFIDKEIEEIQENNILYSAYSALVDFYITIYNEQKSLHGLYHLFYLFIKFSDIQLLSYLPEIKKQILQEKYPDQSIRSLKLFLQQLTDLEKLDMKIKERIYIVLIETYIEVGDADEALKYLDEIYNQKNNVHVLLRAKIFEIISSHECIKRIDNLFKLVHVDSIYYLRISLCKLHILMRLSTQNKAKQYATSLKKNSAYKEYPEYGFILSNYAEFIDDPSLSCELYQESIHVLENTYLNEYTNLIYTNLSMSYAYCGELKAARETLDKMKIVDRSCEIAYLNNNAALDILERKITSETIRSLNDALLLVSAFIEDIIIHNNLLIVYTLGKDKDKAEKEFEYISKANIEKYDTAEFLLMNYQNMLFYKECFSLQTVDVEIDKIRFLLNRKTTSKGVKRLGELMLSKKKDPTVYYSGYSFKAEFICYWGSPLFWDE